MPPRKARTCFAIVEWRLVSGKLGLLGPLTWSPLPHQGPGRTPLPPLFRTWRRWGRWPASLCHPQAPRPLLGGLSRRQEEGRAPPAALSVSRSPWGGPASLLGACPARLPLAAAFLLPSLVHFSGTEMAVSGLRPFL